LKLHIGSGSVYLRDWVNIDVPGPKNFLAVDRPDLIEQWGTHDGNYYKRHRDKTIETLRDGPLDQEYVCDQFGSWLQLPIAAWSVDEVLSRHSFEHLSLSEARAALDQLDEVMIPGGILRLDVPDHAETVRLLQETKDPFYARHLLGPRRDAYGFHMMSYTRESLRALVEEHGFGYVGEEENIHFYPAFCLRFEKRGLRAARDYVKPPCEIPDSWKVLEIGPGDFPFERANVVVDWNYAKLEALKAQGKETHTANFADGLPQFKDKEFDYVWCSHVFEHVDDPIACAKTLSRIGKRGTLVVPSAIKESLFMFEEAEHKWLILPNPQDGEPPIFVRHNEAYVSRLKDTEVQKIGCKLFRIGPNRLGEDQRYLRRWYYENEPALDIVVHWEGELGIKVVA